MLIVAVNGIEKAHQVVIGDMEVDMVGHVVEGSEENAALIGTKAMMAQPFCHCLSASNGRSHGA